MLGGFLSLVGTGDLVRVYGAKCRTILKEKSVIGCKCLETGVKVHLPTGKQPENIQPKLQQNGLKKIIFMSLSGPIKAQS